MRPVELESKLRSSTTILSNAATFESTIKSLEGITSVETDAVTGSALIHFDENKIKHEQITNVLEEKGYFIMSKAKTSDEEGHRIDYYYNYVPGRIRIETPFLHNNPQQCGDF